MPERERVCAHCGRSGTRGFKVSLVRHVGERHWRKIVCCITTRSCTERAAQMNADGRAAIREQDGSAQK